RARDRPHRACDAGAQRAAVPAAAAGARTVRSGARRDVKAFVTGVAGFIGSTLADRLLADGADVLGVDNFSDYYPRAIKERNIAAARSHPRFRLVDASLQALDLRELLQDRTHVFHLAAQAGVRKSWGRDFAIYT